MLTIDVMGRYPMDNNDTHIPTHSSGLASVRWNPGGQLHRCVTVPYVSLHVASAVVESFTVHVPSHDPTTVTKSFINMFHIIMSIRMLSSFCIQGDKYNRQDDIIITIIDNKIVLLHSSHHP